MSPDKKKIKKISNQIDRLASKGKDNIQEYYKFIDDIVEKGDYNYLEMALHYSYFIDINDIKSLEDVKKKTWDKILFQTNTPVSKKIKNVLDNKGVYQMSFSFYRDSNSQYLGDVVEFDKFSPDSKYYIQNKQYAKIIGTRVTYLEVSKVGATSSVIINDELPGASEETNLVNRYKIAVDYLLS
jgi:hypothetical protein